MLLFNIFLSTSIHLPDFIEIGSELIHNGRRLQNLRPFAKSQNPAKELIADLNLCGHGEMGVIQRLIPHAAFIVAETIHNRIQKRIDTVSQILSWGFAISHFFSLSTLGLILAGWLSLKTVMGFCLQIH